MPREFTAEEAERHNRLFEEACRLVQGELHVDGQQPQGPPDFRTRLKLKRALCLFEKALEVNPDNGAAYFFVARVHLRCGDTERCMRYILRAQEILPNSPGVAREAIMVAIKLGKLHRAVEFAKSATARMPQDGGVFVNMGLALLFSGRPGEAESAFRKSADLEPDNATNPRLASVAARVAAGKIPPLRNVAELARAMEDA